MTIFVLSTLFLVGICLYPLIPVLLNPKRINEIDVEQQNLEITKYRLEQLNPDLEDGGQQAELEAALLDDLGAPQYTQIQGRTGSKFMAAIILLVIPLAATTLYIGLGNFAWLRSPLPTVEEVKAHPTENLKILLERLEQTLNENPENADGWALAGRTYMSLGRFEDAEQAYGQVHRIVGDDPDILTAWADASLMVNGNIYNDEIAKRINRALELDPVQVNALWIAAMGARSLGRDQQALGLIKRLGPLLGDNEEARRQLDLVKKEIGESTQQLDANNEQTTETTINEVNAVSIEVHISIDPGLINNLPADSSVFVFAKAVAGPPFPLAAAKLTLGDLPATVILDDTKGMVPGQVISNAKEVLVTARISRTGDPVASSGDLTSNPLQTSTAGNPSIALTVDQVVK